jgi:hypothetical protein
MEHSTEKKYRLLVKGNVKMLTVMDSFATSGDYSLYYHGLNATKPDLQEYVLEEKLVQLTEYFDPNTYQLIEYINKLAMIYNRQHICINSNGEIKGLLNMPEIRTKWDDLKKELLQINPISAFEIIRHKDRELDNPQQLIENLMNAHFMHLFLYAFSDNPGGITGRREKLMRDRMGIGFLLPVIQSFSAEETEYGYQIRAEGILNEKGKLDKSLISSVTGEKMLEIKHYTRANFKHDHNGTLTAAEMTVFEQLNNDYKTDLYLNLECI